MAAGIEDPTGKAAGRVTIVTTLTSLIPPVAISGVLILCAVLDIINSETAGIAILTALGLGAATTGTVYQTAKKTPTDQARVIWGSAPVSDVVTPVAVEDVPVVAEGSGAHRAEVDDTTAEADALAARAAAIRRGGGVS